MINKEVQVQLASGIHALNAVKLKEIVDNSNSLIFLKKDQQTANCKDIISLINLRVKKGDLIFIYCDGIDEEETIRKVINFLKSK